MQSTIQFNFIPVFLLKLSPFRNSGSAPALSLKHFPQTLVKLQSVMILVNAGVKYVKDFPSPVF